MGATLGQLKLDLTEALGTSETAFFTNSARTNAINKTIREILDQFDVTQYQVSTTIGFSAGIGSLPTDCLRPLYLVDQYKNEYIQQDYERFLENTTNTYKIAYSSTLGYEQIQIYPTTTTSLTFFYMVNPTDLSSDTDTVRFNNTWNRAIAEKAAGYLLLNARQYDVANAKMQYADSLIAKAWQNERLRIVGRAAQKITSLYGVKDRFLNASTSFTTQVAPAANMTFLTITANVQGLSNYGYFANGTSRISVTLPPSDSVYVGNIIEVQAKTASGWRILQNADNQINVGASSTTLGTGGYVESTAIGDTLQLVYQGNGVWSGTNYIGTLTYV